MDKILETQNASIIEKIENTIRENSIENDGQYLEIINKIINWDDIVYTITPNIQKLPEKNLGRDSIKKLVKCLVLKEILKLSDTELYKSILSKYSYRDFIGVISEEDIPGTESITSFHKGLLEEGLLGTVIDKFSGYLSDSKLDILENIVKKDLEKLNMEIINEKEEAGISEHVKLEIEERLKLLYGKKIDTILSGLGSEKSKNVKEKLSNIKSQIEKVIEDNNSKKSQNIQKLINIDHSINNFYKIALKLEEDIKELQSNELEKNKLDENTEIQLFNPFYKALDDYILSMNYDSLKNGISSENMISDKLRSADDMLKELLDGINIIKDISASDTQISGSETEQPPIPAAYMLTQGEVEQAVEESPEVEVAEYEISGIELPELEIPEKEIAKETVQEPFMLTPKFKKAGIFSDGNLTEDYELGFRFHQLGLKMGFFNVKLDINNESSRISTAEFFPNTFWASVKQRSRWIAGICLQNWKANKWKGNLSTKYFLFRDRKSLFSIFGTFFSNVILMYIIITAISGNLFNAKINPLVDNSSVLMYLIFANLFFMLSRASHRFMFTYNWYGFKYAFFSFFRLILDNFINFFAIIRSLNVYKQTKKKVVWDSTDHY